MDQPLGAMSLRLSTHATIIIARSSTRDDKLALYSVMFTSQRPLAVEV